MVTSWVVVQKKYSKMHLVSWTNTHRDVTDLVNHGMVKNTRTGVSWERNIIFLQNKKILNLCFILRSYRFVAEVTFKHNIALVLDLNKRLHFKWLELSFKWPPLLKASSKFKNSTDSGCLGYPVPQPPVLISGRRPRAPKNFTTIIVHEFLGYLNHVDLLMPHVHVLKKHPYSV